MADSLDTPLDPSQRGWKPWRRGGGDKDGFGRFAEATARFMGSPSFVLYMTIFVTAWIVANVALAKVGYAWDEYPFILLNLAFSTQASYSAPLIMLAQNRQDDRDRVTAEQDRQYLTREIAALRIAMNDVATRDFVRSEMRDLLMEIVAEERNLIQAAAQQQAEFAQRQAQLDAQQQLNNPNHD